MYIFDSEEDVSIIAEVNLYRAIGENYVFILNSDGKLEVLFGIDSLPEFIDIESFAESLKKEQDEMLDALEREGLRASIRPSDLIEEETIILSEEQLEHFIRKVNALPYPVEENNLFQVSAPVWRVVIKHGEKTHIFAYGRAREQALDVLVSMFIEASPIEVVDRDGRNIHVHFRHLIP